MRLPWAKWGLVFVLVAILSAAARAQTAGDYCRDARDKMAAGNYRQALQAAERGLQADPKSSEAESLAGAADFALGDLAGSETHSRRALELQPSSTLALRTLGATYLKQQRYGDARRRFQQLLVIQPADFVALYSSGLTLLLESQPAEAMKEFERARKVKPRDPTLLGSILQAQLRLKQQTEAASTLAELEAQLPPRDLRRTALAAMLVAEEAYDLAIPEFQALLKEQPESYEFSFNLALANHRAGNDEQAAALLRQMLAHKERAELQNLLGEVEQGRGNNPQALGAFLRATQLEPHNEDYRYDYAQALAHQWALDPALAAFQGAVKDFPNSARCLLGLGATYYLAGRYEDAAQTVLQGTTLAPQEPRAYYLLGRIYDAAGSFQAAISAHFEDYLRTEPKDAWAHYFYGRILASQGRRDDATYLACAERYLRQAVALDDGLAEAHAELGSVLDLRGQSQGARAELERAVQLDSKSSAAYYRLAQIYRKLGEQALANKAAATFQQLKEAERADLDREQIQRFLERAKR